MQLKGILEPDYQDKIPVVSRGEFQSLVRRVSELERAVKLLSSPRFTDQARTPYAWGDQTGEPYYHHGDIAGSLREFVPWISTTTRFSERLTSGEFFWVTFKESLTLGACFGGLGAGIAWVLDIPIATTAATCGIAGFILSAGALILLNRWDIHTLARGQADRDKRKRQELEITVNKVDGRGKITGIEKLCVQGITEEQIKEFAPQALRLQKLAVNTIGGGGKLFSQGQAQELCAELEFMGYVTRARGNQARTLTLKGFKFFLSILEPDDFKVYVSRMTREQLKELGLLTREWLAKLA